MSETALLWVLGLLVMCLGALAGIMWRHVEHCKEVHSRLAEIGTDVKYVMQEIGTHETGLRGSVHGHTNALLRLDGRVTMLEEREDER